MVSLVDHVALGDSEVELPGVDGVDVVDRTAGGFDGAADAGLLFHLVRQAADGASGGIVDPGDPAGADGDELGG